MDYWSKGLGRRLPLHIDWSKAAIQITIEDGHELLASVVPAHLLVGELPPGGEQVVVAGDSLPPIVWRYISVLRKQDFEDILELAAGQKAVQFLNGSPGGGKLFLKLAGLLVVFLFRYLCTWALSKARGLGHRHRREQRDHISASHPGRPESEVRSLS